MDANAFWATTERGPEEDSCWLWTGTVVREYGMVFLEKKHWRTNRLAWTLARGPIPEGMYVLHTCDEPLCVRPEHLYVGTQSQNMKDMYSRGHRQRPGQPGGEDHAMAKLTEGDVRALHARMKSGESHASLALEYKVCQATLRAISSGTSWKTLNLTPIPRKRGSQRRDVKLTEADIPVIVQQLQDGATQQELALKYGVSRSRISNIWTGKTWKHVPRAKPS